MEFENQRQFNRDEGDTGDDVKSANRMILLIYKINRSSFRYKGFIPFIRVIPVI